MKKITLILLMCFSVYSFSQINEEKFNPALKVLDQNFYQKSNTESESQNENFIKIRLGFDSVDNYHRQILIGFMNDLATDKFDYGYDVINYDNNPSDMYFVNGNNMLVIQGVGAFNPENYYPLGYKSNLVGTVTFKLDNTEYLEPSQDVFIYDNVTAIYHNIKTSDFNFDTEIGTFNDRFSMRFLDTTLDVKNPTLENGLLIAYAARDRDLNIYNNLLNILVEKTTVFNLMGQQIGSWYVKNQNQKNIKIQIKDFISGTYLAVVDTTKGSLTKKIFVE